MKFDPPINSKTYKGPLPVGDPVEPEKENRNLAVKALSILGSLIMFVLTSVFMTTFMMMVDVSEERSWKVIRTFWIDETFENPAFTIALPLIVTGMVVVLIRKISRV
jgi:hypothetical protein